MKIHRHSHRVPLTSSTEFKFGDIFLYHFHIIYTRFHLHMACNSSLHLKRDGTCTETKFRLRQNGQVHLYRQGHQFSWLLAAELCASAVVMLDTPRSEGVWDYWLTTPFASFPFTSPPVRHRVPSDFKRTLTYFKPVCFSFSRWCTGPYNYYYYYYYRYSALGPVWAETTVQSGDWYGSGMLHPGHVLRGSLPLLSPTF